MVTHSIRMVSCVTLRHGHGSHEPDRDPNRGEHESEQHIALHRDEDADRDKHRAPDEFTRLSLWLTAATASSWTTRCIQALTNPAGRHIPRLVSGWRVLLSVYQEVRKGAEKKHPGEVGGLAGRGRDAVRDHGRQGAVDGVTPIILCYRGTLRQPRRSRGLKDDAGDRWEPAVSWFPQQCQHPPTWVCSRLRAKPSVSNVVVCDDGLVGIVKA